MGHHGLPDAHGRPDHGHLLQSPVHHQRHRVLPNGADCARSQRPRRRNVRGVHWRHQAGATHLPARQLQAGSRGRGRAEEDRRDRRGNDRRQVRHRRRRRQDPRGQGRPPAGRRRTGNQAGAATPQSGHGPGPRHREAAAGRRGPAGHHPLGHGLRRKPRRGASRPCSRRARKAPRRLSTKRRSTSTRRSSVLV